MQKIGIRCMKKQKGRKMRPNDIMMIVDYLYMNLLMLILGVFSNG